MELIFYLDDIEIEEPIGFKDIELSIIRDDEYHGIGFEASTGTVEFWGDGAEYLRNKKETEGIKADVIFRAEVICNAYQEEENIFTGRVNFGIYIEKCGDSCTVSVGFEEDSCIVTLRNRIDQKVDIDSLVAFDKMTALPDYVMMGEEITLPAVQILAEDWATLEVSQTEDLRAQPGWFDNITPIGMRAYIGPAFDTTKYEALGQFYVDPIPALYNGGANNRPPYLTMPATVIFNQNAGVTLPCDYTEGALSFKLSGTVQQVESTPTANTFLTVKIFRLPVGLDGANLANWVEEYDNDFMTLTNNQTGTFDIQANLILTISPGDQLWYGVFILVSDADTISQFIWTQNAGDYFRLTAGVTCDESVTESYLIHETLSRAVESITNGCARVKSEYYGRTESQPFDFTLDGCGGLRMLTSGLKIRRAEQGKDYFFASFKQLLDGLNAIDNIGFGLEDDPDLPNRKVVRVEDVAYFYKDEIILTLPLIPAATSQVKEDMYVSKIKIGYKNWEVEKINGLDEINSTREYRTSFETIDKTLDLESELVSGSYAIELTRQQSFASTGAADTSYDNEIFIICVNRNGYNTFSVEVGEISESTDVYSPQTKYNIRITPARNMLRWYKSVANGYVTIADSTNKIFFSSGTGNISACIKLINNAYVDACINESVLLCENQDIFYTLFYDQDDAQPIWKNETINFQYPLSIERYREVKKKPYGRVSYQCDSGEFEEGYIKEIRYRPVDGTASFTLIKKY